MLKGVKFMFKRVKSFLLATLMMFQIFVVAIPVNATATLASEDFTGTDGSAPSSDWVLSIPTGLGTGGSASAVITGNALNMSMKKVNVSSKTFTTTKTLDNPVTGTVEVDTRIKSVQNPEATSYVSTQFRLLDPSNSCLFTVTTYIGPSSMYFQYSLNNSSYTTISGAPDPASAGPAGDGYHNVKIILDCNQKLVTLYIDNMNIPLLDHIALAVSGSASLGKITLYSYLTSNTSNTYDSSYYIDYVYVYQILDLDFVQAAYDNLTLSTLTSDSQNAIINNLNLPSTIGTNGVNITWSSDTPGVISNTGIVTPGAVDQPVTLTATLTKGSSTMQKSFAVTVLSQQSVVSQVSSYLDTKVIDEDLSINNQIAHNITLPKNLYGSSISWNSDSPNLSLSDTDANTVLGTVTLPANWYSSTTNVILTAQITNGSVTQTKNINLILKNPIIYYGFDRANDLPDTDCAWTIDANFCSVLNGKLTISPTDNRGIDIYYNKATNLSLKGEVVAETRFNCVSGKNMRIDLMSNTNILSCMVDADYHIQVYYGSNNLLNTSFTGTTLTNNHWYTLKFIMNTPSQKVRIFLDGNELTTGDGVPFRNATNYFKHVYLNGNGAGTVSYEYLKVYDNNNPIAIVDKTSPITADTATTKTATFTYSLGNPDMNQKSICAIVAVYDNTGKLIAIKTDDRTMTANSGGDYTTTVSLTDQTSYVGYTVKGFLWSDLNSITPIFGVPDSITLQ